MLRLEMNLNRWHDDGELVSDDIRIFHNNNKLVWKNIHKKSHRKTIDKNTDTNNALICIAIFWVMVLLITYLYGNFEKF
mgnify:CR=1 FL=1